MNEEMERLQSELKISAESGVRIDIWTHLMRGCIINYVH